MLRIKHSEVKYLWFLDKKTPRVKLCDFTSGGPFDVAQGPGVSYLGGRRPPLRICIHSPDVALRLRSGTGCFFQGPERFKQTPSWIFESGKLLRAFGVQ